MRSSGLTWWTNVRGKGKVRVGLASVAVCLVTLPLAGVAGARDRVGEPPIDDPGVESLSQLDVFRDAASTPGIPPEVADLGLSPRIDLAQGRLAMQEGEDRYYLAPSTEGNALCILVVLANPFRSTSNCLDMAAVLSGHQVGRMQLDESGPTRVVGVAPGDVDRVVTGAGDEAAVVNDVYSFITPTPPSRLTLESPSESRTVDLPE